MDIAATVRLLVDTHGESGICPTAVDWRAILDLPANPISILNLLGFHDVVHVEEQSLQGAKAYQRYSRAVAPAFQRCGGKLLFMGQAAYMFPKRADEWDFAVLSRYPSPQALADMWLDPEFIAAHSHRINGVARSTVVVFKE